MIIRTAAALCVVMLAAPALAGDSSDSTSAAMNKCVADTSALGAKDPQAQCQCFVDSISEDTAAAYAKISDWESEATGEMKDAGAKCFPELQ